jgi:uncharacterized membrane protein
VSTLITNYWIVWPVGIVLWVLLGWTEFGYLESRALSKKKTDPNQITLSMFIYTISTKFPFAMAFGFMMLGMFIATLMTHFYWHWCPPGSISAG